MANAVVSAAANSEFAPRAPSANSIAADVADEDTRPLIAISWSDMHITAKLVTNSAPPGGVNIFTERSVAFEIKPQHALSPVNRVLSYFYGLAHLSIIPLEGVHDMHNMISCAVIKSTQNWTIGCLTEESLRRERM